MCKCIEKLNEKLKAETGGFAIDTALFFDGSPSTPYITTSWQSREKKPRGAKGPTMLPSYCPFCGEKYPLEGGRHV